MLKNTSIIACCLAVAANAAMSPVTTEIVGDWSVKITFEGKTETVAVPPVTAISQTDEKTVLMDYIPNGCGWCCGTKPSKIAAQECTARFSIIPESLVISEKEGGSGIIYEDGKDYKLTPDWGTVGRLPEGRIKPEQPVFLSYKYYIRRLDSIIRDPQGKFVFRNGTPHTATPAEPLLKDGELRLANIWLDGPVKKLDNEVNVFPLSEQAFPEPTPVKPCIASKLIPKTYAKLKNGEKVRILAWGDSVTVGTFVPNPETQRWQNQFVARLQKVFPKADIELITEAWGGRNTDAYFAVPAGQPHNYQETVLAVKPDLCISEFVNDGNFNKAAVYKNYGRIRDDFKRLGTEWILLTPHYIRPDWMGLSSEKNADVDPRGYTHYIREFASENNLAVADASLRFGRLWRRGIPPSSLMVNAINHPNVFGLSIFADALMQLFKEP